LYIILNYTIEMKIYVWKKLTLMQISWHGLHNFIRVIILIKRYWSWYLIGFSHNCFKTLKNVFLDLYIFKVSFLSCNIITSHINEKPFFFFFAEMKYFQYLLHWFASPFLFNRISWIQWNLNLTQWSLSSIQYIWI